jgi:hypothetical protein
MSNDEWQDREDQDDESCGPEAWSPELTFGDPDAWRGDAPDTTDAWRGDLHSGAWPEWSAGPEYFMWKRLSEGDT